MSLELSVPPLRSGEAVYLTFDERTYPLKNSICVSFLIFDIRILRKYYIRQKTQTKLQFPRSENRPKANKEKEEIQSRRTDSQHGKSILTTFGIEFGNETSHEESSRWVATPGHPEVAEEEELEEVMGETTRSPEMLRNRRGRSKITSSTSVQRPMRVIIPPLGTS